MDRTDALKIHERRFGPEEMPLEYYGVELAPKTVEGLVTWDISGRAQCEKDRLSSIYRVRKTTRGGY